MAVRVVILLSLLGGLATSAEACRLPHRLLIRDGAPAQPSLLLLSASVQQTAFELADVSGYYTQFMPRLEFRTDRGLLVGSDLPLIALNRDDHYTTRLGVGNPVLFGQYRLFMDARNELHVGLQLEIPLGDHNAGVASDHVELLPHLIFTHTQGWLGASADFGYRHSVGAEEEHADHESRLLVDPHSDSELLYRVALTSGRSLMGTWPSLYIDGQAVLARDVSDRSAAAVGFVVGLPMAERYILVPSVEFPVTKEKRMNWSFRISAEARM